MTCKLPSFYDGSLQVTYDGKIRIIIYSRRRDIDVVNLGKKNTTLSQRNLVLCTTKVSYMEEHVSLTFPKWLFEAAKATAAKKGQNFDDMLRLISYEYVERHGPEHLLVKVDGIPVIVRVVNAILSIAIDNMALEIRLALVNGNLSILTQEEDHPTELYNLPGHIRPQVYDRFIKLAGDKYGTIRSSTEEASFIITHNGLNYGVSLSWNGDYQAEMSIRIKKVGQ